MPGILAERTTEELPGGKGGQVEQEREDEEKKVGKMEDIAEGGETNQMLKAALEELSIVKNDDEAAMDEEDQPQRLSSPDSGVCCLRERKRERERERE